MPRRAKELSALEVKRLVYPGEGHLPVYRAVGGVARLQLQLTPGGGKSWILRCPIGGKRRSMGLGPYPKSGSVQLGSGLRRPEPRSGSASNPSKRGKT